MEELLPTTSWTCEICGLEGPPHESKSCWTQGGGFRGDPKPTDIGIFTIGVYSLKVCSSCRMELGSEGLREKLREKIKRPRV